MLLFAAVALLAVILANGEYTMPPGLGVFNKWDTNRNGWMSSGELRKVFKNMDTNRDRQVTLFEFKNDFACVSGGASVAEASNIYSELDYNGDGILDRHDRRQAFKYFDINRDGVVDPAEFARKWRGILQTTSSPTAVPH